MFTEGETLTLAEDQHHASHEQAAPDLLVVGGGKGGVGKTCFAVNVAVAIARKGWRVVLVDADLSCSNIEEVLGTASRNRLDDFFRSREESALAGLVCDTHYENLRLIPGTTGLLDVANPRRQQKSAFMRELRGLEADLVIVDLDAGAHLNTLDFFLMTDTHGVLIINPEKTSIDNAYKFLRAAVFRKIERFYDAPEVAMLLKRNQTVPDFIERVKHTTVFSKEIREQVCGEIVALARALKPKIVVNRAHTPYEAQVAANILCRLAGQDLMVAPDRLGFLFFDKHVTEAVNSGVPFVVSHPELKISSCVADIANRLGYL